MSRRAGATIPVGRRWIVCFFLLTFVLYFRTFIHYAPKLSYDSYEYANWADQLIMYHFNFPEYFRKMSFVVPPFMYSGWVLTVAMLKQWFMGHWQVALTIMNLLIASAMALFSLGYVSRYAESRWTIAYVGVLFALCKSIYLWIPFVLSDIFYLGLSCFLLFWLIDYLQNAAASRLQGILLFCLFCFLLSFRPTALPIVALGLLALGFRNYLRASFQTRRAFANCLLRCVVLNAMLFLLAVFSLSFLYLNLHHWQHVPGKAMLLYLDKTEISKGVVVQHMPAFRLEAPQSFWDYVKLFLYRFCYFFSWNWYHHSIRHVFAWLRDQGWFMALYGFLIFSPFKLWRQDQQTVQWRGFFVIALFAIVLTAQYLALTSVNNWLWRYRMPVLPFLILLSAFGFDYVLGKVKRQRLR